MKIMRGVHQLASSLYASVQRFPITISFSIAATVVFVIMTSTERHLSTDMTDVLLRVMLVLALGIPLSLCVKLLMEKFRRVKIPIQLAGYIGIIIVLTLYYFLLLPDFELVTGSRYISLSIMLYLAFVIIPFFYKREHFERYLITISTRFFVTALYAFVLFIGVVIILFTLDRLLNVPINAEDYVNVFAITVGIFAPCFFLAGVPTHQSELESWDFPKLLRILLVNIVIPLIVAYSAILYIYFAKILITTVWPEGLVGHLVLWYAIVSIGVMIYLTPLRQTSKAASLFIRWFPLMILPILVMMFISIGIRIHAYGFTENRYYVIALGIWITMSMLYVILVRNYRNLFILLALAIVALLAVVGPWSAFSVAKHSQNERFERLLLKYDMIDNGEIVHANKGVAGGDQREMSEIISYFDRVHRLTDLNYLPEDFSISRMETVFGFPFGLQRYDRPDQYYSFHMESLNEPLNIQAYDYFVDMQYYYRDRSVKIDEFTIHYSDRNHLLYIDHDDTRIYEQSLLTFFEQLVNEGNNNQAFSMEEMTFTDETEALNVTFIFKQMSGSSTTDTAPLQLQHVDFYLFVDLK